MVRLGLNGFRIGIKDTDLSRCVPLVFHCDDGEAHRRRSFMISSFGSAVVHKSPWDCRFVLYCTDNAKSCDNTYDTLDTWLAWSFTELGAGRFLEHSPWGEVMGLRKSTWVSEEVCFTCRASRRSDSELLYTGFGKNALHRTTMLSLYDFVTDRCNSNPWVRVPGLHPSMVTYDWLHVLDLSLIPDASASATRLHIFCLVPSL